LTVLTLTYSSSVFLASAHAGFLPENFLPLPDTYQSIGKYKEVKIMYSCY